MEKRNRIFGSAVRRFAEGQEVENTHDTVVKRIPDPKEKPYGSEEVILLTQVIELWVSIEHTSRDELVENTNDQRWEDGEYDIVECHCPSLERDLTAVIVKPRVPEERERESDVLVERVWNQHCLEARRCRHLQRIILESR